MALCEEDDLARMIREFQEANRRTEAAASALSEQRAHMAKSLSDLRANQASLEGRFQGLEENHEAMSRGIDAVEQRRCARIEARGDVEALLHRLPIATPPALRTPNSTENAPEPEPEDECQIKPSAHRRRDLLPGAIVEVRRSERHASLHKLHIGLEGDRARG
eukprot:CAMPEP_0169228792 /NCGR_PEP_ID=MMETSP1016-20121227/25034_1 /TAXON_ID=342587 /ORGANISM="Karlodinium micrum, Strain CCMP2283" /LENGTH=162 /DNA_ID=CAMNT_0009307617 /DNA_START=47 /DNA_END=535 /DNA_ORIENTATION=+